MTLEKEGGREVHKKYDNKATAKVNLHEKSYFRFLFLFPQSGKITVIPPPPHPEM